MVGETDLNLRPCTQNKCATKLPPPVSNYGGRRDLNSREALEPNQRVYQFHSQTREMNSRELCL